MAVAYEQYEGSIEAPETDSIDSEDLGEGTSGAGESQHEQAEINRRNLLHNGWPIKIASVLLFWGCVCILLGFIEIVVIPLVEAKHAQPDVLSLNKTNLYGVTIWGGITVFLTSLIGLRSSIKSNVQQVYVFFLLVVFNLVFFTVIMVYTVFGFVSRDTLPDAYKDGSALFSVRLCCTVATIGTFISVILAFVQYYEDVLFGPPQLCRRWVHCCLPCWCPRAVDQEELLQDDYAARPPSLPV